MISNQSELRPKHSQIVILHADFQHKSSFHPFYSFIDVQKTDESQSMLLNIHFEEYITLNTCAIQ